MIAISKQLGFNQFPIVIKNNFGKIVYYENSDGWWYIKKYDNEGNETETITSTGEHKKAI